MPADIDEANATITLSINADPAKRANWTAISTSQITTTYTGVSLTPSTTTLDLSNDNDNVATYTVKNADGKSKVYTLKVEFVAFRFNIDKSGISGVSSYDLEVYYSEAGGELYEKLPNITGNTATYTHNDYLNAKGRDVIAVAYLKDASGTVIKEQAKIFSLPSGSKSINLTSQNIDAGKGLLIAEVDWTNFQDADFYDNLQRRKNVFLNQRLNTTLSTLNLYNHYTSSATHGYLFKVSSFFLDNPKVDFVVFLIIPGLQPGTDDKSQNITVTFGTSQVAKVLLTVPAP